MVHLQTFNIDYRTEFVRQFELIKVLIKKWDLGQLEIEKAELFKMTCRFFNMPQTFINILTENLDEELIAHLIHNKIILTYNLQEKYWELINSFIKKSRKKNTVLVSIFAFGSTETGWFPSEEFYNLNTAYIFNKFWRPLLVSKRDTWFYWKKRISPYSWTTKSDVILLSSLYLSHYYGAWNSFFLEEYMDISIRVPKKIFKNKFSEDSIEYIKKVLPAYEYLEWKFNEWTRYQYFYDNNRKLFRNYLINIPKNNIVLIKCLYYFIKASALWKYRFFWEEQVWLLFFTIDWLIKLLMEKFKLKKVKELSILLEKEYGMNNISILFERLNESRIWYVHPQNSVSNNWHMGFINKWDEIYDIIKELFDLYIFWKKIWNP